MAIYHLNAKVISRGKGQSAIAAAAYRSGEKLRDEQADEQKHYTSRAERIQFTDIMAPKDAPEWAHDRNQLWNRAEQAEKRKDAQLAREIEVSLPHELTPQQRVWLAKDFAREAFVRRGYAVDIAIHAPDPGKDERNHHAHFMVTMRTLGPEGFAAKKDPSLNTRQQLGEWREQWAHLANRHLERHGHDVLIDHRSLKDRGEDREPTMHLGYAANEIERRGAKSDRGEQLHAILERNEIRVEMKSLDHELKGLEEAQRRGGGDQAATAPSPMVPIEALNAAQVAAEAGTARKEAMQAREHADRQDARRPPTDGKGQEQAFRDTLREEARETRQEGLDANQAATQKAWSGNRDAEVARVTNTGTPKSPGVGLNVVDTVTGAVEKLGDFVLDLLGGGSSPPPEQKETKGYIDDPVARKEQQIARVAARRQAQAADKALDRIGEDMEAGRSLKAEDIKALTRQHQEQIKQHGDDAMRQMVDDARKRSEKYWKGDERERDR